MIAAQLPAAPAMRGYRPLYQAGSICPACGSTSWHIGRHSAECARCATALPFAPVAEVRRG
jgi:tRNA(Ile2) C34 agmatinyltransferase TiaS